MKPGDIVYIKSGSPAMTVKDVNPDRVETIYWDYHRQCQSHGLFPPETLVIGEPGPVRQYP